MWNLGSVSELTIFRPLAFIEILLNLAVCTKSFSVSPRPFGGQYHTGVTMTFESEREPLRARTRDVSVLSSQLGRSSAEQRLG